MKRSCRVSFISAEMTFCLYGDVYTRTYKEESFLYLLRLTVIHLYKEEHLLRFTYLCRANAAA